MNPQTAFEDVKALDPGAICISPVELRLNDARSDVKHYQVPFMELANQATDNVKLRKLLTNMIYVGVVAQLLGIDQTEIDKAIENQFKGKTKAIDFNLNAVKLGREWASENLKKDDPYFVERSNQTAGKIIIDGNDAAALGSLFAGATVVTWYPITPSSSLCEYLIEYLDEHRHRQRRQSHLCRRTSRRRTGRDRHGAGRRLRRCPLDDFDVRPRNLLDGRVCRLRLFHRNPHRHLRHSARRTIDRHADTNVAG